MNRKPEWEKKDDELLDRPSGDRLDKGDETSVGDTVIGEAPGPVPAANTGEEGDRTGPDADTQAAAGDWQGDEFDDRV